MTTLSEFIQKKREKLGLTPYGLALRCNVDTEIIEEIEAGRELFLPVTIRQNLAKGLKVNPNEIKKYEKNVDCEFVSLEEIASLKERILDGETELYCPKCGSELVVRIAKMMDLEDNVVLHPKAHCSKCVFQIH